MTSAVHDISPCWPPGGSADGRATVVTANGPGGTLVLLRAVPSHGTVMHWRALVTRGRWNLGTAKGDLVLPEGGDPIAAIVRTMREPDERPDDGVLRSFLSDVTRWEASPGSPAAARWTYFSGVCGEHTLRTVAAGDSKGWAGRLEAAHGAAAVGAALERDPILLPAFKAAAIHPQSDPAAVLVSPASTRRDRAGAAISLLNRPDSATADYPFGDPVTLLPFVTRLVGLWERRPCPVPLEEIIVLSGGVPSDWLPGEAEEIVAMARIGAVASELERASAGVLPLRRLLAPVRGRWVAYLGAAGPEIRDEHRSPKQICSDVADGVAAFRADVVDPVRALAKETLGADPKGCASATAWRALHGGRGLAAVLEGSRDWHGRASAVQEAVASLCNGNVDTWPRPFEPFASVEGLVVAPLATLGDAAEEGRRQRHCVASYVSRCLSGESALATIGRPGCGPDDRSTAELKVEEGRVVAKEHRGFQNGKAPSANVAALGEALLAIQASGGLVLAQGRNEGERPKGDVPRRLLHLAYDPRPEGTVQRAVSAWARFLRGDLRDPFAILALGDPEAAKALSSPAETPGESRLAHALSKAAGSRLGRSLLPWIGVRGLRNGFVFTAPALFLATVAAATLGIVAMTLKNLETWILGSRHVFRILELMLGTFTAENMLSIPAAGLLAMLLEIPLVAAAASIETDDRVVAMRLRLEERARSRAEVGPVLAA